MYRRKEYTAKTYPSFGKKYNGEKAIISLTSWKARINTVSKTIFSLVKECPGFHIVLVLSQKEFPKMCNELPENLMFFVEEGMIELLWVYKNYKSLKKILFTMDKYRHVSIISADDDCIYKFNYAEELYNEWLNNKDCFITYWGKKYINAFNTAGYATLHPPYIYKNFVKFINLVDLKTFNEDDLLYLALREKLKLYNCINLNKSIKKVVITHDELSPLHDSYKNRKNEKVIDLLTKLMDALYKFN